MYSTCCMSYEYEYNTSEKSFALFRLCTFVKVSKFHVRGIEKTRFLSVNHTVGLRVQKYINNLEIIWIEKKKVFQRLAFPLKKTVDKTVT